MIDQRGGEVGKQACPSGLTRREFLRAGAGAGLFVLGLGSLGPISAEAEAALHNLDLFAKGFPRAFSFRQAESAARDGKLTYEEWEKRFLPLDGIAGKVLNEAHDFTGKNNITYFLNYKQRNPSKMVLLHYNGTGRRATDEATTKFIAGHFLHYRGTKLTERITSQTQNVLHVEDISVFDMRRYSSGLSDDISVVRLGADGSPMWETAEQVRLLDINRRKKAITVQRGMYGTTPHKFSRRSYLAAHVTTGPYGADDTPEQNIPLWSYNFSTECPRDAQGRNCADALVDYLGEKLGPGGELESLDGIVFDVFSWVLRFGSPIQEIDVNTDGEADGGVVEGHNVVGAGVSQFLEALRERLPDKILLADGHVTKASQRGFGHLNGMESEGYPDKADFALSHVSRGENIFGFWKENSGSPSFNYLNFRYKQQRPQRWRNTFIEPNLSEDDSYRKLRLALASGLFTDSAFGYGGPWTPPDVLWTEGDAWVRVFDELWRGTDQVPHWLGQPLAEAVHLATQAPDLFEGQGVTWTDDAFIGRLVGEGVAFSREGTEEAPLLAVRSVGSSGALSFVMSGIDLPDSDLFVSLRLRAEPLERFPASVPRCVDVSAVPAAGGEPFSDFTWAGEKPFSASLYFQDVGPGTVELRFEVEGGQPVYLESLTAHSAADGRYRAFDHGVVFANPSTRDYTFDVETLFPGVTLRRLQGTATQDPQTNDGSEVGDQLTLSARNGLFVVRSEA